MGVLDRILYSRQDDSFGEEDGLIDTGPQQAPNEPVLDRPVSLDFGDEGKF